jgi:hypothetical protein
MSVPKNVQFTNLIKSGGRLREFNFRRSQSANGPIFTVDVPDDKGEREYLIFYQENKQWIFQGTKPATWIDEALPRILEAINVHL